MDLELEKVVGHHVGAVIWTPGPVQEQQVLITTKPSLQPFNPAF